MSEWSGFFDANLVDGSWDRAYLAEHFAKYFSKFIGNGVYAGSSDSLQVLQSSPPALSVVVSPGSSYISGYTYENDSPKTLTLEASDGILERVDIVVNCWDSQNREVKTIVKTGTPAVNAVAPSRRWDEDYKELQLAEIRIPAGTTSISQANIKDTRADTAVCGWVTAVISQVDTATLFAQWQSAYEEAYSQTQDYLEAQRAAWEDFFQSVTLDLGLPIPSLEDSGKFIQVNPLGDGYQLSQGKSYASASGSLSSLSLPKESITPIPLDTWKEKRGEGFSFNGGNLVLPEAGTVLILASVYFTGISTNSPSNVGPYVKKNGEEILGQLFYSESTTAISSAPYLTQVEAGDELTLCARNTTKNGSCIPNARLTRLTVIYV